MASPPFFLCIYKHRISLEILIEEVETISCIKYIQNVSMQDILIIGELKCLVKKRQMIREIRDLRT